MKRTRDTLTGGTGDVNPQILQISSFNLPNANQYTQVGINLPVNQLPLRNKNKAIVMELLKVYFDISSPSGAFPDTPGAIVQAQMQISTASTSSIQHSAPQVIAWVSRKWKGNPEAGTPVPYAVTWVEPEYIDLTDGAGHGVLVATNQLYAGADTTGYNAVAVFSARLLYRWKEVDLTEYLGMVQSQQTPTLASGQDF